MKKSVENPFIPRICEKGGREKAGVKVGKKAGKVFP